MPEDVVGSASVVIKPDMSYFEEDLKAKLEEETAGQDGAVPIKFKADTEEFKAEADAVELKADEIGAKSHTVEFKAKDDFSDFSSSKWDNYAQAVERVGKDFETFDDKLAKAGISVDELQTAADKSGISLESVVTHLDNASGSTNKLRTEMDYLKSGLADGKKGAEDLGKGLSDATNEADRLANDIGGSGGGGGLFSSLASLGKKATDAAGDLGTIPTLIATIGPALVPLAGVAAGTTLAFGSMFAAITGGLGAFGLAAFPVFKQVSTAMQQISSDQQAVNRATSASTRNTAIIRLHDDIANLNPEVAGLVLGIDAAKNKFLQWDQQFQPEILDVFNRALQLVDPALRDLAPLVDGGAKALDGLFGSLQKGLSSPAALQFTTFLGREAPQALGALTSTLGNFGAGLANMFEALQPFTDMVERGLVDLSKKFENWTASDGFKSFVSWLESEGPKVAAFFSGLFGFVEQVILKLTPLGDFLISILGPAFSGLAQAVKAVPPELLFGIAAGIAAIMIASSPIVAVAAGFVALGFAVEKISEAMKASLPATAKQFVDAANALNIPKAQRNKTQAQEIADLEAKGYTVDQIKQNAAALSPHRTGNRGLTSGADSIKIDDHGAVQAVSKLAKPPDPRGWKQWGNAIGGTFIDIKNWATIGWHGVYAALLGLSNFTTQTLPHAFDTSKRHIIGWFGEIHRQFNTDYHAVFNDVLLPFSNFFSNTIPHAASVFSGTMTGAWQGVHNIINTSYHAIQNDVLDPIYNFFTNSIPNAADHVKNAVTEAWTAISSHVHQVWSGLVNDVFDPIKNFFTDSIPNAADHVKNAIAQAWDYVYQHLAQVVINIYSNVITPIVNFFTTTIPNAADTVATTISGLPGKIISTVGDWSTKLEQLGKDLIHGIVTGIGSAAGSVGTAILNAIPHGTVHLPGGISFPYAQGGIVTRPTFGLVGEDGPEAILPLSKPQRFAEILNSLGISTGISGGQSSVANSALPAVGLSTSSASATVANSTVVVAPNINLGGINVTTAPNSSPDMVGQAVSGHVQKALAAYTTELLQLVEANR